MRRLLACGLLPARAGQPVKALAHVHVGELVEMGAGSVLQDKWIEQYRARWAVHRAATSVATKAPTELSNKPSWGGAECDCMRSQ